MRGEAAIKRVRRWHRRYERGRKSSTASTQTRPATVKRKRRHTSWTGWRILAGGILLLIFGSSTLSQSFGPSWLSLLLIVAGLGMVVYGRRH
jgi:hypothetical protein